MTWPLPRRDVVLRDVLAELDRRLDGRLPMDVPGVDLTFRDPRTLLDVLHARALPGLRMVLDDEWEKADDSRRQTLVRRRERQHQWLAARAGWPVPSRGVAPEAVAAGAALEAEGRRYYRPGHRPPPPPLLKRLRAALAA